MEGFRNTCGTVVLLCAVYLALMVCFGFIPDTMVNYGYDYLQFLHPFWLAIPVGIVLCAWGASRLSERNVMRVLVGMGIVLLVVLPIAFCVVRTRIHVFGGDGAVGCVPVGEFSFADWTLPFPGKGRLDGFGGAFVAKCCQRLGLFAHSFVMPSILSAAVYSILVGVAFTVTAFLFLRKKSGLFPMFITMPFIFNFFGNVDSYVLSLYVGLVFLLACLPLVDGREIRLRHLILLGALAGLGMWTHPFHAFDGFILAVFLTRYLKRKRGFSRLPDGALPTAFGVVFLIAVKMSPYGNTWFAWPFAKPPPAFSLDTFTHWFNMLFLPLLPWMVASFLNRKPDRSFGTALRLFGLASAVFFCMAFTLGTVDQFNYQHLLFFFLSPWVLLAVRHPLPPLSMFCVALCNLCLLIPMVAVHSSDKTVARAEMLYPLDPCQHNRVMSWQTHLGLTLGDNLQESKVVKRACLRTFRDGAQNALPSGFRSGNHIYHTAFLYHFGEFEQGRKQLEDLLAQNPRMLGTFLGERPAFIYCNREKLWADIDQIVAQRHPQLLESWRQAVAKSRQQVAAKPFYVRRPPYAKTAD